MPRKLRLEYSGAIHHLINRGDRREPIFKDDTDRRSFLELLAQGCARTGWQVHAFVLMPNHVHFGDELRESAEAKAQRLIARELRRERCKESDLEARPKGDDFKVRLAALLRRETTVTVEWIVNRLSMGTRGHLTHLLYWRKRRKRQP